jgi:hypothetical protein
MIVADLKGDVATQALVWQLSWPKKLSPCLRVKSASTFFPKMTIMKALLGYLCFSFLKLYVL